MAAKPLKLRCKTRSGQHRLESLTCESTVTDLKACLFDITGIEPLSMKVFFDYPPRRLDLSNENLKLGTLPLKSGDTLIVEENIRPPSPPLHSTSVPKIPMRIAEFIPSQTNPPGILMRRVVPANNSCLFTSVYFALSGGEFDILAGQGLRQIIADVVAADKETYNEAFLGKPNKEYCTWILNEDHWGGAIELSILSKYYGIEIVAVDTQNVRLNRFGEDADYESRIFLIYDGIHFDPLMMEPLNPNQPVQTIFLVSDDAIMDMAVDIAMEAKSSRQFTDVKNFSLRCLVCNVGLRGQVQAQEHAKETGHINFGEV